MSSTTCSRLRNTPPAPSKPGFSRPGSPKRTSFITLSPCTLAQLGHKSPTAQVGLVQPPTVNDVHASGGKCRLVGGKVDGKCSNFCRRPKAPHGLSVCKAPPRGIRIAAKRGYAAGKRRRLYCAGTDDIAPHSLRHIVSCNCL